MYRLVSADTIDERLAVELEHSASSAAGVASASRARTAGQSCSSVASCSTEAGDGVATGAAVARQDGNALREPDAPCARVLHGLVSAELAAHGSVLERTPPAMGGGGRPG